ncbi:MAG TPA: GPW/gp25 family protein [Verrucomicrobiae bacterium]|jgi:type VI secretion system protein ImpF|nr:GPW/gp25 family protein [Verrucomicrobiae bacterium]
MSDPIAPELLQPCLLDRLTDNEPARKEESRRERVVSYKKYRDGVLRDLEWLLNSEGFLRPETLGYLRQSQRQRFDQEPLSPVPDLRRYPEAYRSVINYGLKQFWGLSDREKDRLQEELSEALQMFEPRLLPGTIHIELLNPNEQSGAHGQSDRLDSNQITLLIAAELWANPLPEQLNVKTTVDLEVGQCLLGDAPHG